MSCIACGETVDQNCCNACWSLPCREVIRRACVRNTSTDPIGLADAIMRHPQFPITGPAHHSLVAGVILSCLRAAGAPVGEEKIEQALQRADQVPSGYCSSYGADAAAIACGVAVAVLEGTTIKAEHAAGRTLAHQLTGQAMLAIAANSGNRCCKRSVFNVLETATTFFIGTRRYSLTFPATRIQCRYARAYPLCNAEVCRFYAAVPAQPRKPVEQTKPDGERREAPIRK